MHASSRSFMSLGPMSTSFSHYFSYHHTIAFHHISLVVFFFFFFFVSFTTCFSSSFPHPEWWSSSVHYMEDGHIISIICTMDIDLKTLSLRRSYHWREFMVLWCLRAHPSIINLVPLVFICLCSGYVHLYICKKKKKNEDEKKRKKNMKWK